VATAPTWLPLSKKDAVLLLHRQPLSHFMRPNILTSRLTSSNLRPSTAQLYLPPKSCEDDAQLQLVCDCRTTANGWEGRRERDRFFRAENLGGRQRFDSLVLAELCASYLPPFGLGERTRFPFFLFIPSGQCGFRRVDEPQSSIAACPA
jgi:hypothetical protein